MKHRLDMDKAVEVLLYITRTVRDMYKALKVLYFADKQHLANYGRFIYGESYAAIPHGPTASAAYDILKAARGDKVPIDVSAAKGCFSFEQRNNVTTHRDANLDLLSDSDCECLDAAIAKYGHMSFAELKALTHAEPAFRRTEQSELIPIEFIVESLPESDLLMSYMRDD